jgi:hypothetical protein
VGTGRALLSHVVNMKLVADAVKFGVGQRLGERGGWRIRGVCVEGGFGPLPLSGLDEALVARLLPEVSDMVDVCPYLVGWSRVMGCELCGVGGLYIGCGKTFISW